MNSKPFRLLRFLTTLALLATPLVGCDSNPTAPTAPIKPDGDAKADAPKGKQAGSPAGKLGHGVD